MPECTGCGTELELDYSQSTELDGDVAVVYQTGYCPNCGKQFTWIDYFEFSRFSNLKEAE